MRKSIFKSVPQTQLGKKQAGASSLEYIALAAIIVAILLAVDATDISTTISDTLTGLFDEAGGDSGETP